MYSNNPPDLPLFAASTPERLIVGIGAGLALGIDTGDCACCVGGFGVYFGGDNEQCATLKEMEWCKRLDKLVTGL